MSAPENIPSDVTSQRADVQSSSVVGPDGTIYIANFADVLWALRDSSSASDRLEPAWSFHMPGAGSFHATPALSSDAKRLYLGLTAGAFQGPTMASLYSLDTANGQVDWSADLGPARVMASPTVGPDGTVYVGTSAQLFAVAVNGSVKWAAQTGPTIKSAPGLGADGTVYEASSDGKMYAVSAEGQLKWSFDFEEHLGPTPVLANPTPGPGGQAFRNPETGSGASPTVAADGTVFIGANNSNMYAVHPDGSMKWLFEAEREQAGIWTTPVLSPDGGVIYFGANKGGVYAVNTADGSKRWQFAVYGSIYASSVLDSRGVLFTGTTIEHLYALDATRGEPLWDLDVHNAIWSAPSIRADGTLVIADRGGVVQVIG
jgi:outer membrane protein assembly factor BamB